jgi:hypothetical protein
MRFRLMCMAAILVVGIVALPALAQNDLSFYPVRTLAEATKDSVNTNGPRSDYYFDARGLKSRSTVTFTGETRKLTEKRKRFMELWLESRGMPANAITALSNEAQFQEGTVVYWMPIPKGHLT